MGNPGPYTAILCLYSPPSSDVNPELVWSEGHDSEVIRLLSQAGPSVHQGGEQDGDQRWSQRC